MSKQYAVIGLGKFGFSVATTLAQAGKEVLAVDKDAEPVQEIADLVTNAARADMAESETGIRLGKSLISGGFQDFFMLSDSFSMVELPVPEAWTGHNLEELDLRKKYSINVIAVKDGEDIRVTVNPKTLLRAEEVLILIGENKELAKLMKNRK